MSRRALRSVAVASALVALAGPAHAQPPGDEAEAEGEAEADADPSAAPGDDPDPGAVQVVPKMGARVPEAYRQIDVSDFGFGLRDDYWSSIQVGPDGTIYIGTHEGRAYVSRDDAQTWTEGTVIPEVKPFFGFAAQGIYLGSLRRSADLPILRAPQVGPDLRGMQMLVGDLEGARNTIIDHGLYSGNLALTGLFTAQPFTPSIGGPVAIEAGWAAGAADGVLGVGLSNRAPRLSLLLAVRGRTVPNISLDRLLITSSQRPMQVRRIFPHPDNPRHLFAASRNGLYESRDGGVSWMRTYAGATAGERGTYLVVFDPQDHERVYLGTERGMYMSDNGGLSWKKNTAVPEFEVKNVIIDPTDPRYVYAAGNGGVFRSSDRARTFALAYYSTQKRLNDVQWMVLDPFDPDHAYLGTSEGLFVTQRARTSRIADFRMLAPNRTLGLNTYVLAACSRHRGHIYMMTRGDLFYINYNTDGPEVLLTESWDGGETWRDLLGNRTQGELQWFTIDPRDPDTVWVAFTRALLKVSRAGVDPARPSMASFDLSIAGPTMTQVLDRALEHNGVAVGTYQARMDRLRTRAWIPSHIVVAAAAGRRRTGGDLDDNQFAADRLLRYERRWDYEVMAWASWRLPSLIYDHQSVAMQRLRVQAMNDEVRQKILTTIHKNYGELQRLRVRTRTAEARPLYVRAIERVRMEQLEAVVDLTSGGYLTEQQRKLKPRKEPP